MRAARGVGSGIAARGTCERNRPGSEFMHDDMGRIGAADLLASRGRHVDPPALAHGWGEEEARQAAKWCAEERRGPPDAAAPARPAGSGRCLSHRMRSLRGRRTTV